MRMFMSKIRKGKASVERADAKRASFEITILYFFGLSKECFSPFGIIQF